MAWNCGGMKPRNIEELGIAVRKVNEQMMMKVLVEKESMVSPSRSSSWQDTRKQ